MSLCPWDSWADVHCHPSWLRVWQEAWLCQEQQCCHTRSLSCMVDQTWVRSISNIVWSWVIDWFWAVSLCLELLRDKGLVNMQYCNLIIKEKDKRDKTAAYTRHTEVEWVVTIMTSRDHWWWILTSINNVWDLPLFLTVSVSRIDSTLPPPAPWWSCSPSPSADQWRWRRLLHQATGSNQPYKGTIMPGRR